MSDKSFDAKIQSGEYQGTLKPVKPQTKEFFKSKIDFNSAAQYLQKSPPNFVDQSNLSDDTMSVQQYQRGSIG